MALTLEEPAVYIVEAYVGELGAGKYWSGVFGRAVYVSLEDAIAAQEEARRSGYYDDAIVVRYPVIAPEGEAGREPAWLQAQ